MPIMIFSPVTNFGDQPLLVILSVSQLVTTVTVGQLPKFPKFNIENENLNCIKMLMHS